LRKLNELEVRKQYQIEITNRFAALGNLNDNEEVNRDWENIKENIKTSAKEGLVLHELKQHKPCFDEGCLVISFVIPVVFIIKLDWSVCICLTQLYDGRDMYRIYYINNNYMFRHFTLAIFRLRNEKLSKQLYSTYVGCI